MEAIAFLAAVVALGVVAQKVVEFVRGIFPNIDGNVTRLVALVVGSGLAYAFNLDPSAAITASIGVPIRDFPPVIDFIIGGFFIGSAAGYLADRAGRSNSITLVSATPVTVKPNA